MSTYYGDKPRTRRDLMVEIGVRFLRSVPRPSEATWSVAMAQIVDAMIERHIGKAVPDACAGERLDASVRSYFATEVDDEEIRNELDSDND